MVELSKTVSVCITDREFHDVRFCEDIMCKQSSSPIGAAEGEPRHSRERFTAIIDDGSYDGGGIIRYEKQRRARTLIIGDHAP